MWKNFNKRCENRNSYLTPTSQVDPWWRQRSFSFSQIARFYVWLSSIRIACSISRSFPLCRRCLCPRWVCLIPDKLATFLFPTISLCPSPCCGEAASSAEAVCQKSAWYPCKHCVRLTWLIRFLHFCLETDHTRSSEPLCPSSDHFGRSLYGKKTSFANTNVSNKLLTNKKCKCIAKLFHFIGGLSLWIFS